MWNAEFEYLIEGINFPGSFSNKNLSQNGKGVSCRVKFTSSWNSKCPSGYLNFTLSYRFDFNFNIPNLLELCEGRK